MPEARVTVHLRRVVVRRARGCCEYCRSQARFATQAFSVEHIIPRSRAGETNLDNLALACEGCNGHKHTKVAGYDFITNEMVPLYHPRQQIWGHHFRWNDDYTLIIGLTPTGRVTIEALHLNRAPLVNLRRVLYAMGEHPPRETSEMIIDA